jgi:hypothetical protein
MVFLLYYNRDILACFAGKIVDYAIDLIEEDIWQHHFFPSQQKTFITMSKGVLER